MSRKWTDVGQHAPNQFCWSTSSVEVFTLLYYLSEPTNLHSIMFSCWIIYFPSTKPFPANIKKTNSWIPRLFIAPSYLPKLTAHLREQSQSHTHTHTQIHLHVCLAQATAVCLVAHDADVALAVSMVLRTGRVALARLALGVAVVSRFTLVACSSGEPGLALTLTRAQVTSLLASRHRTDQRAVAQLWAGVQSIWETPLVQR